MKTKNIRKKLFFSLLFMLIACGVFTVYPQRVEAAKKISSACAKAYAKKLNSLAKNAPSIKGYVYTIVRDMNNDGVPELMYNTRYTGSLPEPWTVYTWKKGKVKKMGSVSGTLYSISGAKSKYKFEAWFGVGCCSHGYVTFSKSKITQKKESSFEGMPTIYELKGKKTTKAKYNKFIKKFQKSMTRKRMIKATDVYGIKWNAKKVMSIVS